MSETGFTLALAVVAAIIVGLLYRALRRPGASRPFLDREAAKRQAYFNLAQKDRIDPSLARSFRAETETRIADIERKRREEENRKVGDIYGIDPDL